jgi:anti-sigma regulatory factor (Ser/Thr protein kinase)
MRRPSSRVLLVVGLLAALLLAGVASVYASGRPDGLERVAEDQGFAHRAEEHPAAESPLADYELGDGGGTGVAGVIGVVAVLTLATGGAYALRGRGRDRR